MEAETIELLDSTLRDGAQAEGITFSVEDKIKILLALDQLGIPCVEAGNPTSNPKDLEFFQRARALQLQQTKLVAFGSTRRRNCRVEEDSFVSDLLLAGTPAVSHLRKKLGFPCDGYHSDNAGGKSSDDRGYDPVCKRAGAGRDL